jgi:hypothetical protein
VKGTVFSSPLVLTFSNQMAPMDPSISCKEAYLRRRHIVFEAVAIAKVRVDGNSSVVDWQKARDIQTSENLLSVYHAALRFRRQVPTTDKHLTMASNMNLSNVLKTIKQEFIMHILSEADRMDVSIPDEEDDPVPFLQTTDSTKKLREIVKRCKKLAPFEDAVEEQPGPSFQDAQSIDWQVTPTPVSLQAGKSKLHTVPRKKPVALPKFSIGVSSSTESSTSTTPSAEELQMQDAPAATTEEEDDNAELEQLQATMATAREASVIPVQEEATVSDSLLLLKSVLFRSQRAF